MSSNTFGHLFRYTTWGESHGEAIGCVIDGVPPKINLSEKDIQPFLDRRRPGQNKFTTQRDEADQVKILSGVFEGMTTGTPISLMIENTDARSRDYTDIKDKYRPGHADYTYDKKYGVRDYRGGGRSSARETAMRVAAGAVALKILQTQISQDIQIRGFVASIGEHEINPENFDWDCVRENDFFTPDKDIVPVWEKYLTDIRKSGSSIGAVVEIIAENIPVGLGAPVAHKLDADLASAMMGINAVKGVEIGSGFAATQMRGENFVDEMRMGERAPVFLSNNAGGILGGISTGQDIVTRIAFKPTSSILTPVKTITVDGENTEIITKGRHDPCVGIRGVPVAEAMMAIVLCDHWLRHKAQNL